MNRRPRRGKPARHGCDPFDGRGGDRPAPGRSPAVVAVGTLPPPARPAQPPRRPARRVARRFSKDRADDRRSRRPRPDRRRRGVRPAERVEPGPAADRVRRRPRRRPAGRTRRAGGGRPRPRAEGVAGVRERRAAAAELPVLDELFHAVRDRQIRLQLFRPRRGVRPARRAQCQRPAAVRGRAERRPRRDRHAACRHEPDEGRREARRPAGITGPLRRRPRHLSQRRRRKSPQPAGGAPLSCGRRRVRQPVRGPHAGRRVRAAEHLPLAAAGGVRERHDRRGPGVPLRVGAGKRGRRGDVHAEPRARRVQ